MPELTQSYVCGTSTTPLIGATIGAYFDHAVERWGDREAIVMRHQNIRLTYAELKQRVDALAAGLIALGLEPGDRVGIWSPNKVEWVVTQFATAKVGLIQVNINPSYRLPEVAYAINCSGCKAVITAERCKTSDYIAMLRELAPEIDRSQLGDLNAQRLPSLKILIRIGKTDLPGFYKFEDVPKLARIEHHERLVALGPTLQFDDAINIQFTSGTTGSPKGATLSHHSILNNAFLTGERLGFTAQDRLCVPVPLYHCFGMVTAVLNCLTHGAAAVFPAEVFDPLSTLEALDQEKCTALYGVPTMFVAMLSHPDFGRFNLSSLRTGIMAGSPCPIEVMGRAITHMHLPQITIAFGMTETSPVITQTTIDDSVERRVSTVGTVFPHTEVKIVDSENRILPIGVRGEICARGYLVMRGYWNDQERTREAIDPGGWMHTGDLATMDADGYCNIVGRVKDMVVRGGENIYPREIEEFLYTHPKIEAVQAFGVPDVKYGEEVCVWIKLRGDHVSHEEEIRAFCKGQIAHYKIPRYVRFVDEFPLTVTGKIQKFVMRDRMIAELQLVI